MDRHHGLGHEPLSVDTIDGEPQGREVSDLAPVPERGQVVGGGRPQEIQLVEGTADQLAHGDHRLGCRHPGQFGQPVRVEAGDERVAGGIHQRRDVARTVPPQGGRFVQVVLGWGQRESHEEKDTT